MQPISPSLVSPEAADFARRVNALIEQANLYVPTADTAYEEVDSATRVPLLFFASIAFILALAGSIGEAAFQYRLARNEAQRGS
jgi:hypothetical protein